MFDYINTKYDDAEIIIDDKNAKVVVDFIKQKIDKYGESSELYSHLSKACIFADDDENALKYAKKACELDDSYIYAKVRLIFAYSKFDEEKERALSLMQELYKSKDLNILIHYICLLILLNMDVNNDIYFKIIRIISSKKFTPKNKFEYWTKILGCILNKKYKTAKKFINEAEAKNYISQEEYYTISHGYYINQKYEETLNYINKAIAFPETDYRLYYRKGWCLYKIYKKEEALENFLIAEKLGCKWVDIYNCMTDIYYRLDNNKKAVEYANKALMLNCNNSLANYNKGVILFNEGKYDKALKYLLKSEELGFISEALYNMIAYIFAEKENYNKQIQYLNKWIIYNPADYRPHYEKGESLFLFNSDNYIDAKSEFLKAEELGGEYSLMYSYLSNIYQIENDFNKALQYINKAILKNSQNYYYFYFKSDILYNMGKEKEADRFFQKALLLEQNY